MQVVPETAAARQVGKTRTGGRGIVEENIRRTKIFNFAAFPRFIAPQVNTSTLMFYSLEKRRCSGIGLNNTTPGT